MSDGFIVIGWVVTAAVVTVLWRRRLPARPVWPGVLVGLALGLLWPLTLWVAVGMCWHQRGRADGRSADDLPTRIAQAHAFRQQAVTEGMPVSAAYWSEEAQRLTATSAVAAQPLGRTRTATIVAVCAVGSVVSVSALGGGEPQRTSATAQPSTAASSVAPGYAAPAPAPALGQGNATTPVATESATVTKIIDGDTVEVSTVAAGLLTVRVLGIDSPEVAGVVECGGPDAREFATRILLGQAVELAIDPTQDRTDRYSRALRYVTVAGQNYSVLVADAGYARAYVFANRPVQAHPWILAAENRARAAQLGIWGGSVACSEAPPPAQQPAPQPVRQLAAKPKPKPAPAAPAPVVREPARSSGGSAYYKNCSAARAAGAAPVRRGDPGYAGHLDRDGDGIGCE